MYKFTCTFDTRVQYWQKSTFNTKSTFNIRFLDFYLGANYTADFHFNRKLFLLLLLFAYTQLRILATFLQN